MRAQAVEALEVLDADFGVDTPVRALGMAARQTVEIAKALHKQARVLLLDEPSSSLTAREVQPLFRRLRELAASGLCVVYISHRLEELLEICDRIAILRDGEVVLDERASGLDESALVRAMTGRDLAAVLSRSSDPPDEADALRVDELVVPARRLGGVTLGPVSFSVGMGETLGIFGNVGAGRTELLSSLVGVGPQRRGGDMTLAGKPYRPSGPVGALKRGIAFVSEDRKEYGIEASMSVLHNVTLTGLPTRWGFIRQDEERRLGIEMLERMGVVYGSPDDPITSLSGGNQQKVLLARALLSRPRLLLLDEPGRGVDVGAKAEILGRLKELAALGLALIVASSEPQEILGLADRIAVLHQGRHVGTFAAEDLDEHTLGTLANGSLMEAA
jgi:ABC-type sugar transport system ATPase subunit